MSALDIYAFYRDGDAHHYEDIRNSWQGGWAIWKILTEKYNCKDGSFGEAKFKDLWDQCSDGKLSDEDTITCMFTFDRVWVKRENALRLSENLKAFRMQHGESTGTVGGAAHVLSKGAKDDNVIGFAFNMTNIGECLWYRFSSEADDYEPYNVLKEDRHWELFEEFDKIRS